jgi:2-succinyl-5-enolpyruvyl-6-hydroxy-3-cyclohexene-1-carboxylate synthase
VDRGDDRRVTSEAERSLSAAWWIVDELVRCGLEQACLSPGSRSTPLALALMRHPHVRAHVHLDERASAFFALGLAKATARPVAVACTSGTAAANLLPAVVEASMSRARLVLLTADRPPELRGVGANQTIDQVELFGRYVRSFVDAEVPGDRPDERYWRGLAADAVGSMIRPPQGPVHINLPFREPLVPGAVALEASAPPGSIPESTQEPEPEEVEALRRAIGASVRGVVVAGSLRQTPPRAVELARRGGWPLVAEPTSGLRVPGALRAGQHLLADETFAAAHLPDVVLQLGAAPTSRAGLAFVGGADRLVIVDPDHVVADPNRRAAWAVRADAGALLDAVLDGLAPRGETPWLRSWLDADAAVRAAVDRLLDSWEEPFEGRIARDLAAWLPEGSALCVGSSMPIRDLDAYLLPREGIGVIANRGASGIDGFVSTTLGVAATGAPTYALLGDLTLLHDVGSLLWSARRDHDAVLVVPNNDGGGIFSFLAHRDLPPVELEDLFTTPHRLNLATVAAAAGAGHHLVTRADELIPAVERAHAAGGVRIVEVRSDRERNVDRHREVQAAVAAALAHA